MPLAAEHRQPLLQALDLAPTTPGEQTGWEPADEEADQERQDNDVRDRHGRYEHGEPRQAHKNRVGRMEQKQVEDQQNQQYDSDYPSDLHEYFRPGVYRSLQRG